jgi:Cu(I)/Ag(I) efflux system membrane fusion protein/cobalt-zinc-cadmium efflux system membrane fusion protein
VPGRAAVSISPDRQRQIGLCLAGGEAPAERQIRTVARVAYAEPKLAWVTTKFQGWIEKLYVDSTGQAVRRGDPLFEIYSPDLYSAQVEYLLALDPSTAGTAGAIERSALLKLEYFDISDEQIAALAESRETRKTLRIHAPMNGFVVEKRVAQGQMVEAGMKIYRIADLSTVWLLADIYEYELAAVKPGQQAIVTLPDLPGERLSAKVGYIYPYLEGATRTVKVRLEVPNPGLELKPEMWANV